jgi:uncharacterized NAD-dependent epimerase/dehydratase family protein
MKKSIDGKAIIYAEGSYNTLNGKTAHGLVRFTERYDIVGLIDRRYAGQDAGLVLDNIDYGIPIFSDLYEALEKLGHENRPKTFIVGLAPDGGRLPATGKKAIRQALMEGMNVDSGLHDFIYKDAGLMAIAAQKNAG